MKVGDLVKMRLGYSSPGVILSFELQGKWARVHWSDYGPALEKIRDLEVLEPECSRLQS